MKKALGILLVLVLIATVFVSCSQDAGQKVAEELVSVSFDGSKARSLTPSRDPFDADEYVWTYTAQKADDSGLTTGETATEQRINTGKGLAGKVPGFSQGYWNFTLYAYAAKETTGGYDPVGDPLYSGTASHVKVAKGDENVITVSVSPATTGTGYIAFDRTDIILAALKTIENIDADGDKAANFFYGIYAINDVTFSHNIINEGTAGKTPLKAGSYFVRVSYTYDETFVIADEAIVAVVYGGQTTTIKGSIGELSTDVSFGANEVEIPSAEGTKVAVPENLSNYEDTDAGYEAYQEATDDSIKDLSLINDVATVSATVPARAVYSLLQESDPDDPNTTSKMSLNLTVDINTQETTASQMAYDVNLIKTVETTTTTTTGSSTSTNASLVKNVAAYVSAEVKVGKDLRDVKVYHSGNLMKETEDISNAGTSAAPADETEAADAARDYAGFFLYDDENGILYLKTKSFSPFVVTFTPDTIPETARVMNVTRGVGYVDLQDAVDAAVAGETLRLIDDIEDLTAQVDITKRLTLDLNGKTISNTVDIWNKTTGAWSLISVRGQGAVLTITGNGILDAKENDCYALDVRDAKAGIIIENGTYVGNITAAYALIGSITVNGGSFDLKQLDSGSGEAPYRYMLNCLDANFKEGTAVITVTGGSFHMFNPAVTHGEPTDPTSYVPEGYPVYQYTESGDNYYKVLTLVEAKDATCSTTGTHTYWKDSDGNKYIVDKHNETISVATETDLIIPAHHAYVFDSYTTVGCEEGYCKAKFICLNCNHVKEETRHLVIAGEGYDLYGEITKQTFHDGSVIQLGSANYATSASNELRKSFVLVGASDGSSVLTVKAERGTKMYNRVAPLPEKSWHYANLTIQGENNDNQMHLILLTGQKAEIGLNNVTVKNFTGTASVIGLWENQPHQSYEGKTYPSKSVYPDTYLNIKALTVDASASDEKLLQIQSFEDSAMKGNNGDSYESVHITYPDAGKDFVNTQIHIQYGQRFHDGVHNEWFLNGQIMKGIPKTEGIYGESD